MIYFIKRGAKEVIAVESHPGAYQELLENVKLNGVEDRVIPINADLASKSAFLNIRNVDISSTVGTYHEPGEGSIQAITLEELVKDFELEPSDTILKLGCEGCEFDVIINDYEHIRFFKEIYFEYHSDRIKIPLGALLSLLSKDFECKNKTEQYILRHNKISEGELGLILCMR